MMEIEWSVWHVASVVVVSAANMLEALGAFVPQSMKLALMRGAHGSGNAWADRPRGL